MWKFEHTETTSATPAQLWERYSDPPSWPEWDHETERVTLDGPFAPGTTGSLKPVGGPKTKFRVLEVSEPRGFTDVSSLPLAKMYFQHEIEPGTDGTRFTHRITISGPLSPLFARVIGKKIAASLPGAMRELGELAAQPR
jgi:polyketide cyclase/dehydrase/lipid transport protein